MRVIADPGQRCESYYLVTTPYTILCHTLCPSHCPWRGTNNSSKQDTLISGTAGGIFSGWDQRRCLEYSIGGTRGGAWSI